MTTTQQDHCSECGASFDGPMHDTVEIAGTVRELCQDCSAAVEDIIARDAPTISVNDILGHFDIHRPSLPDDLTGVYWTDTKWTECRDHLLDPSWSFAAEADDKPTGVALYGPVECDACAEPG